jgi:predicted extracellular nuclease
MDVFALTGGNMTMLTQTVTVPASATTSGEFIISVINTDNLCGWNLGIIDSVSISATILPPPTITSIYDIQYTTDASGDSPEAGNVVTTSGIVTGVIAFGGDIDRFFIQDGDGAWNGIYVYENGYPVALGDSVEVTGTVTEYFGLTELTFVTNVNCGYFRKCSTNSGSNQYR